MGLFDKFSSRATPLSAANALAGRDTPIETAQTHFINGHSLHAPYPEPMEVIYFGMGCFWGAERVFWNLPGVHVTAVGYASGQTPNPTYEEVCTGRTGHNEVVLVVFDPNKISLPEILQVFWENHDPTQGLRQGNDRGTQYRSGIYATNQAQLETSAQSKIAYQEALFGAGYGNITTEILSVPEFYFAEEYHQQYLEKNPSGYCGIGGTGVACAVGTGVAG